MTKRRFSLTKSQVRELTDASASCRDEATRTRYEAVRRYGTGHCAREVMEASNCSRTSLMAWCSKYEAEGIQGLTDKRAGGNRAKLVERQIEDLRRRLRTYAPAALLGATEIAGDGRFWTVSALRKAVQRWYGVRYKSPSSYHRLLDLCGFSYHRRSRAYKPRVVGCGVGYEREGH